MVSLAKAFSNLAPFKALVIGDFLLDTYTTGKIRRISPEAPVPVMEVVKEESRPGGAGNVVLNLVALGAKVVAIGRIGQDGEGQELKQKLKEADTSALFIEEGYRTPVKKRILAESQQLMRIDFEKVTPIGSEFEDQVIQKLKNLVPLVDVIAISDYAKGFLTDRVLAECLHLAKKHKVKAIVDPKGIHFEKYRGAFLIKPNLSEAYAAAKMDSKASLEKVAEALHAIADILLVTRSEAGISVFQKGKRDDFPVQSKEVKDVTGAGDTVLAMICMGVANGLDIELIAKLANMAAGLSIERLGCVQVTMSELAARLLEIDVETKIFDESHIFALQQVLKEKKVRLLAIEKEQEMSTRLLKTLKELSQEGALVVYVQGRKPSDELIHLLSSLSEVGHIILQKESLKNICEAIQPDEVFVMKENQVAPEVLEALVYTETI